MSAAPTDAGVVAAMEAGPRDWRAIPYAELDATADKPLMYFGDPDDAQARAEYEAQARAEVARRLRDPEYWVPEDERRQGSLGL